MCCCVLCWVIELVVPKAALFLILEIHLEFISFFFALTMENTSVCNANLSRINMQEKFKEVEISHRSAEAGWNE